MYPVSRNARVLFIKTNPIIAYSIRSQKRKSIPILRSKGKSVIILSLLIIINQSNTSKSAPLQTKWPKMASPCQQSSRFYFKADLINAARS